jgi:amino-acid N-acetyltransferase
VQRSREHLETEIEYFNVVERDGLILGCAALHLYPSENVAEIACLALHPDYRGEGRGELLVNFLTERAQNLGVAKIFVLTTQTSHWFLELGFLPAGIEQLPEARRAGYNHGRNSRILIKPLDLR